MKRIAATSIGLLAVLLAMAQILSLPAARGGQQVPPALLLKMNLKTFTLRISYLGPDRKKPLHNLTLSVVPPAPATAVNQGELSAQLSEKQAGALIDALAADRDLSRPWPQAAAAKAATGYLLVAETGGAPPVGYQNELGLDLNTLRHFDAIRAALDGEPAKQMDRLLDDLKDLRKQWTEEGRVFDRDGLALLVKAPSETFGPGKPIAFDLKFQNTTDTAITLSHDPSSINLWNINIHGSNAQDYTAVRQGPLAIVPPKPVTIKAHDSLGFQLSLAPCHYFAQPKTFPAKMVALDNLPPGKYTVELSAMLSPQIGDPAAAPAAPAPIRLGEPQTTPLPITVAAAANPK